MRRRVLACVVVAAALGHTRAASAQIVVWDPANFVRLGEQIFHQLEQIEQQTITSSTLVEMGTRLYGNLNRFKITPVLGTDWDPTGALAAGRVNQLPDLDATVAAMPDSPGKRWLVSQLALDFASQRTRSHALKQGIAIQEQANQEMRDAAIALIADILSGRKIDHSATATLDKLAVAAGIQSQQLGNANQLSIGILSQIAVDGQRQRNAEISQLNFAVTAITETEAFGHSYIDGSAEALRNWRLP